MDQGRRREELPPGLAQAGGANQDERDNDRQGPSEECQGGDGILPNVAFVRAETALSGWWLASYLVLWGVVIVLALLVLALARQVGTLHLRLGPRGALEVDEEGPPLGEAPEAYDRADPDGRPVSVGGPGQPQLILFVSPGCPVCLEVLPSLPAAARAADLTPRVVVDAVPEDARHSYGKGLGVPVISGPEVARDYRIPGTPYAVVLDRFGVVRAKGTVNTMEQLEGLVDTAHRRLESPVG
jgi:methylamine dehydrogenase accessory protein MauD